MQHSSAPDSEGRALLYTFLKIRSSAELTSVGAAAKLSNIPVPKSEAKQTMNRRFAISFALALLLAAACACATTQTPTNTSANASPSPTAQAASVPAELKPALDSITSDDILKHIKTLSSDEFEGRGPGTHGEELSVGYITEQFKRIGLKPGNPDGTYVQKVPLMGFQGDPQLSVNAGGKQLSYKFPDDYVAVSRRFESEVDVKDSDIVFVGYGVEAPEYGWDDYKGVDVR